MPPRKIHYLNPPINFFSKLISQRRKTQLTL